MFLAGNIPTKDQVQFGEFWSCLGIFSNSTNLQNKNRNRKKGENLPVAHQPAHLAGPARPPLQRAAWLARQAAKVLGGGTAARHAAARRPAASLARLTP